LVSFYSDIYEPLCKKKGIAPTAAVIEMGFSRGTAANWKTRESTPSGPALRRIAEFFGLTVGDLLAGVTEAKTEEQPAPKEDELSAEQAALIAWCRTLSPDEAAAALATLIAIRRSQPRPGPPG